MKSKVFKLKVFFYAPVVIASLRIFLSIIILISNPFNMSLRAIQLIPTVVLVVSVFMYLKLYTDGDPVISLLLPTIVQFAVIFLFKRKIEILPLFIPLSLDCAFLIMKGIKAALYPFEIEGEEAEDDFQDFDSED